MDAEIKTRWLAALRSGEYKQGRRSLRVLQPDGSYTYCCLGVLDAVCGMNALTKSDPYKIIGERAKFMGGTMKILIAMNDELKAPFPKIADYIEANL